MLRTTLPLLLLLVAAPLFACKCKPPPPPKESLKQATAVFSGKVTAIADAGEHERAVTIEIAATWKGDKAKSVVVYTADQGAACGVSFEKGKSYLVYATMLKRGEDKALSTNTCTRTKPLDDAAEDVKELGEPVK